MPKITFVNEQISVEVRPGQTILEVAEQNHIDLFRGMWPGLHCKRWRGWCNRCKVWASDAAPGALSPRTRKERARFRLNGALPETGNMRLACQTVVSGDCEVRTRPGFAPPAPSLEWAPDPRPSRWRERWEKRGEEAEEKAEHKKAAPAKKTAAPAPTAPDDK